MIIHGWNFVCGHEWEEFKIKGRKNIDAPTYCTIFVNKNEKNGDLVFEEKDRNIK